MVDPIANFIWDSMGKPTYITIFSGKIFTGHLDALPWTDSWEIDGLSPKIEMPKCLFLSKRRVFLPKNQKKRKASGF